MNNTTQGKLKLARALMGEPEDDIRADLEQVEQEYIATYCTRQLVPGLLSVRDGLKVLFPTTIYTRDGDDTSGVAGMLYPNGEFLPAAGAKVGESTIAWNDDIDSLIPTYYEDGTTKPVSEWTRKEVAGVIAWDGVVSGSLVLAEDTAPHERLVDASITGEWPDRAHRRGKAITPEKARAEAEEKKAGKTLPFKIHSVTFKVDLDGLGAAS